MSAKKLIKKAIKKAPKMRMERDALEAAAELGSVPVFIAGDINIDPSRSAALAAATREGGWTDLAAQDAWNRDAEPSATCATYSSVA